MAVTEAPSIVVGMSAVVTPREQPVTVPVAGSKWMAPPGTV